MRLADEHPELRRKYEQIVASQITFGFFEQTWVQDILHPNWRYLLNAQQNPIFRIPVVKKFGLRAYLQPLFLRSLPLLPGQALADLSSLKSKLFLHLNIDVAQEMESFEPVGKYQLLQWQEGIAQIRAGYSENVKRSLKKAKGLQLRPIDYKVFHTFFTSQKGENLGNLTAAAWLRLEALYAAAQIREQAFCAGVFLNDQLVAAGLFFRHQQKLYFMKGTLNEEGKSVGALVFLLDAVLQQHADSCAALDFIGSNQESIAAFYRKFGAKDTYYQVLKGRWPFV
ncbi:MAG: GNAT family N-acetyltransferase [Crocinitomicaceae bacterium]|nr:GNAT family N-acetyltransferase [Crocinitomicaceae bacterium]